MPIPFIIAGLAAGFVGTLGVVGHEVAIETNEKAQKVAKDAQNLYDETKASLEQSHKKMEQSLLNLGYSKKDVLDSSMKQFLVAYERVKDVKFKESNGLDELSKFSLGKQDIIQIQEMSNIYKSACSSAVAGAATGTMIALAINGSLPIVAGTLSTAGTALATGLTTTALSFASTMTPLTVIAAPVLFFTAFSSSIKADENLEKAEKMYAEAEAAAEEMKTKKTLCKAISDRSEMFNDLLKEVNEKFSYYTELFDDITRKKMYKKNFTKKELELMSATRALAGVVKAIIDTPILNKNGNLNNDVIKMYNDIKKGLKNYNCNYYIS